MNITILGHVCIDNNTSEHTTYTGAGSPAVFMAHVYQKFPDTRVNIIAPYGKDFIQYTQSFSIYPLPPLSEKTLVYENKSHGNDRTQRAIYREYAQPIVIDDKMIKIISQSDIIFLAPLTPDYSPEYVAKALQHAKTDSLKILLPQGYYRTFDNDDNVLQRDFIEAHDLLKLFDIVIVSDQDHQNMTKFVNEWSQDAKVIMTLGDKGSAFYDKAGSFIVPVDPVAVNDIVDSVGSGDIFSASFAYKYYITRNPETSLRFANDIARQCLFWPANNLQFCIPE